MPLKEVGYLSPEYASAFSEIGEPVALKHSGGWAVRRSVPQSPFFDAMGPYPILCVNNWGQLEKDLSALSESAVAFTAVLDPLGNFEPKEMARNFPDVFRPFKEHMVVDLSRDWRKGVADRRHLKKAEKAAEVVEVLKLKDPFSQLDAWCTLYGDLVKRHNIEGLSAFSPKSFERQLQVPGLRAFVAQQDRKIQGMVLWVRQEEMAYYHLAAYNEKGYELQASFPLFSLSLDCLQQEGVKWASLGAGAGLSNTSDGLTRFKKGWTEITRTAYFAGKILDPAKYKSLCSGKPATDFFPGYRG